MPRTERSFELEREIWEAIGEIISNRSHGDPLVDTTFWTVNDHRSYEAALQRVRQAIDKKAGNAYDEDGAVDPWPKKRR
jgi:hypothetical protein